METSDPRTRAGANPSPETERDSAPENLTALIALICLAAGVAVGLIIIIDAVIAEGFYRFLVEMIILVALAILMILATAKLVHKPEFWEHRFIPKLYELPDLPYISSVIGAYRMPYAPFGMHERMVALTWLRASIVDRLWLSRRWDPVEFRRVIEEPRTTSVMKGKKHLITFLEGTKDLSSTDAKSPLMLTTQDFVRLVGMAIAEAETI